MTTINIKLTDVLQTRLDISRVQAVFITLALAYVQQDDQFKLDYGMFGKDAIAQACERITTLPVAHVCGCRTPDEDQTIPVWVNPSGVD